MTVRGLLWGTAIGAFLWLMVGALIVGMAHAEGQYTSDDVSAAIEQASQEIGVSAAYLTAVVSCETGGTFDPYSVGHQGELGAAQLHPRGLLRTFLAWGYSDPYSPYQAVWFLAQEISFGRAHAWSCS